LSAGIVTRLSAVLVIRGRFCFPFAALFGGFWLAFLSGL